MIEISVTYTDTRMTELTFSFNEYRFKKKIEEVLKVRYQIPEDKTVLVNVEAVADNPALHHLVEQVDWGHLYDHEPESISLIVHTDNEEKQIKMLWLHIHQSTSISDAVRHIASDVCTIHASKEVLFMRWLNKYSVHPDVGQFISMDEVLQHEYPSLDVLRDGSVIVLNW
jgi:uncharacterized protein (UPF0147 family)